MSTDKARYLTFLLYLESTPGNWEVGLELMDILIAISPLHDKDKGNAEGQEYKKTHHHVTCIAANPVTVRSVREKIRRVLGNESIAKVQVVKRNMENMYLYLTYESKDAIVKDKYKYAKKDIKLLSSFDIDKYMVLDVEDKEKVLNDVCDMIDGHGLANIRESRHFVKERGNDYNLPSMKIMNSVLRSHTGLIRLYFNAVCQEYKCGQSYVDMYTGEIKK